MQTFTLHFTNTSSLQIFTNLSDDLNYKTTSFGAKPAESTKYRGSIPEGETIFDEPAHTRIR